VLRGITVVLRSLPLLNPCRYGLFAWQLLSHKLCRWLVPLALIVALASHLALAARSGAYAVALAVHLAFYIAAGVGLALLGRELPRALVVPSYFVLVNASILHAWGRYLAGERLVVWSPSQR
jgi:hypothetical protein